MATERTSYFLSLNLDFENGEQGRTIPLREFAESVRDLLAVLADIEKAISPADKPHVSWGWGSDPEIKIVASVNGTSARDLDAIVGEARNAFEAISRPSQAQWPASISAQAQRKLKAVVSRLSRLADVTVMATDREPLEIEKEEQPQPARKRRVYSDWSEVDGRLEVINIHERPYFVIFEHGKDRPVRCSIPNHLMPKIKEALGNRVVVKGWVRYRSDGAPISIGEVSQIDIVPEPRLDIHQLRGAIPNITGEMPSGEFVRRIREDSANG